MKPRNFYLFVGALALWMVWATGTPALVMALAGSDEFHSWGPMWTPTVTIEDLGLEGNERVLRADTRCLMASPNLRHRIGDRIGEQLGGFRWHGPVHAVVRVVAADGGTIAFSLDRGSIRPDYIEDSARDADGLPVEIATDAWQTHRPC